MKKIFLPIRKAALLLVALWGLALFGVGQTSVQDFGTGTASNSSTNGNVTTIPSPTAGTSYARGGNGGSINVENSNNPLGTTGSYLRAVASSTTAVAKASTMVDYGSSTEFYTSFTILFGGSDAGVVGNGNVAAGIAQWFFYQGAPSTDFTSNSAPGNKKIFVGLRFQYQANNTVTLAYGYGTGTSNYATTSLSQTVFDQAVVYKFEIVGNSTTSTINYTYGSSQTVAVGKFDLYANGILIGDDLASNSTYDEATISSNGFVGINTIGSSGSNANIFVDDVVVYNAVPSVIGENPAPSVALSATSLDFGTAKVGDSPVIQIFTLMSSNLTGDLTLIIKGASSPFSVLPTSVNQGGSITVSFEPAEEQLYEDTLVISGGGLAHDATITLSGTGISASTPTLSLAPALLAFGNIYVNDISGAQVVTVSSSNLEGNPMTCSLSNIADFELDDTEFVSEKRLSVKFKPQTTGAKTGKLYVECAAKGLKDSVTLSGTGIVPTLSVDSTLVRVVAGKGVPTKVTLKVSAANLLGNVELTLSCADVDLFSIDSATLVKPANGTLNNKVVTLRYAPTTVGANSTATLTLSSTNAESVVIPLSGTCVAPSIHVDSASLNFAGAVVGGILKKTFNVTGSFLTDSISIRVVQGAGVFSVNKTRVDSAYANFRQSIIVTYKPAAVGHDAGQITFTSGATTTTLPLSGTASKELLAAWTFDNLTDAPSAASTPKVICANLGQGAAQACMYLDGTNGSDDFNMTNSNNSSELTALGGDDLNDPRTSPPSGTGIQMALAPQGGTSNAANGKSLVIKMSTLGYGGVSLSFAIRGTSSGFSTHVWSYSVDGVNFTSLPGNNTGNTTTSFSLKTVDFSSIAAIDNQNSIFLKLTLSGATSSSGNNRLDNIVLAAEPRMYPPAFTGHPAVADTTAITANVKVTLDAAAKVYYTVKTAPAANVTAADVKADNAKDSINVTAGAEGVIALAGLTAETEYHVYIAAENDNGLSEVDSAVFTTLSATAPVIIATPAALAFDTIEGLQQHKTIAVTAENLGEAAQLRLGQSGAFTLSINELPDGSTAATVTVTYTAGASAVSDTVYITGGGAHEKIVVLTGTPSIPTINVGAGKLTFAAMQGTPEAKKLVVKGVNLKDGIKLTKSHAAYTLSKDTVTVAQATSAAGDTIVVTFSADSAATDTIVLTSAGAANVKVALEGTAHGQYDNMVANPGFEIWADAAPDSWTLPAQGSKETTQVHTGSHAAKVAATSSAQNLIQYVNGVEAGKLYTLSFWYYIEPSSTGSGIRIWSAFRNGSAATTSTNDPDLQPSGYQTVKGQWVRFTIDEITAPANSDNFRFDVRTYGNVTAYYDDFSFSEVDPDAPKIRATPNNLAFGYVAVTATASDTVVVTAANITTDLTLSISGTDASLFSVQPALTPTGDAQKVAIAYSPTAGGNHTAKLTVANGEISRDIALSGNAYTAASISEIVTGDDPSPKKDQPVLTTGTVTAIMATGKSFFIQSGSGARSGLYVYRTSGASTLTLAPGDSVTVRGTISEYNGLTELTGSADADITTVASDRAVPAPVAITADQYNKSYHAVLVTIHNATATTAADAYGRYTIEDETGSIVVAKDIYTSTPPANSSGSVTGVGYYNSGGQLLPRAASDVQLVSNKITMSNVRVDGLSYHSGYSNDSVFVVPMPAGTALGVFEVEYTLSGGTPDYPSETSWDFRTGDFVVTVTLGQEVQKFTIKVQISGSTAAGKELAGQVVVYPNPVADRLCVSAPLAVAKIEVIDNLGLTLQAVQNEAELNTSSLATGVYFVRVTFADGQQVTKSIRKN